MFLHLSVILFTWGVCLSACWDTTYWNASSRPPPGPHTPPPRADPPGSRPPRDQAPSLDQAPPRNQAPHPPGSRLPRTRHTCRDQAPSLDQALPPPPPQQTATVADGTHPTGMHYCSIKCSRFRMSFDFFRK